jgi:hypothetical protein
MPIIYALILYGITAALRFCCQLLCTPPGMILLGLYLFVWLPYSYFSMKHHPYPQTASIVGAKIGGSKFPGILTDGGPGGFELISVTYESTYERPYPPGAITCSIEGPIYYTPDVFVSKLEYDSSEQYHRNDHFYLGFRRMVVRLLPWSYSLVDKRQSDRPTIIPAAERDWPWSAPKPVTYEIDYILGSPAYYVGQDDMIECGKDDAVSTPQIGWVGPHADMPIERLANYYQLYPQVLQAILAAAQQ